jgi:hypothetical protein
MKTIEEGLEEAYKKAGQNAYFGNGFNSGVEFAQRFIPIEEDTPPAREKVIVLCENVGGKKYITLAQFIPSMTVLASDFLDDDAEDCSVYNKEKDEYYVIEGWWEYQSEADINWKISNKVVSWRPINIK